MRNKAPIDLDWDYPRLFDRFLLSDVDSFGVTENCFNCAAYSDAPRTACEKMLSRFKVFYWGMQICDCEMDTLCAEINFFHCVFFFLSCRCPQIHPVCILRNCFSSPSTCRYGATLTSTGHLKTSRIKNISIQWTYIMGYNYELHHYIISQINAGLIILLIIIYI